MTIYLDNSATTRPHENVIQIIAEGMRENYGNPSSLHNIGLKAEKQVKMAREVIAKALKVNADELYFTSGATESNNIAILGAIGAMRGKGEIITTRAEHKATLEPVTFLESNGYTVHYVDIDKNGMIDLEMLEGMASENTCLASFVHVNNESGAIQDLAKIRSILNKKSSKCLLHVDAVQSFCKIDIPKNCADLISISAHKIHGPKGIGALYIKKGTKVTPILLGGGQEKNIRSGTENTFGIFGFAEAVKIMNGSMKEHFDHVVKLKKGMQNSIKDMDQIFINSCENGTPYILNISAMGIRSEILLHSLEQQGVYVSSGSACASNRPSPSHVLTAMGYDRERIDSSIRISFSPFNTEEEVSQAGKILCDVIQNTRKNIGKIR